MRLPKATLLRYLLVAIGVPFAFARLQSRLSCPATPEFLFLPRREVVFGRAPGHLSGSVAVGLEWIAAAITSSH